MVAAARRKLRIPIVVQPHRHDVVAHDEVGGDIVRKSSVTAEVLTDSLAVDVNLRVLKRRLELQKHPLASPVGRDVEMFPIPAVADVKLIPTEVRRVERMWQPDGIPQRIIVATHLRAAVIAQLKFPGLVEIAHHAIGGDTLGLNLNSAPEQRGEPQAFQNYFFVHLQKLFQLQEPVPFAGRRDNFIAIANGKKSVARWGQWRWSKGNCRRRRIDSWPRASIAPLPNWSWPGQNNSSWSDRPNR